jgi:Patatin-like phospholipase
MVDAPGRPQPRFPQEEVARVTREAHATLVRWGVGKGTTVVCGGARGADLIVAQQGLELGGQVVLCLALPREEFKKESVELPGTDWVARFDTVLAAASEVRVLPEDEQATKGDDLYERTNTWLISVARSFLQGNEHPHAVIVWNGQEGDGPGGTRDFVRQLGRNGPTPEIRVIDPTPRQYEAAQDKPGPKKLLALDGGGIRGALSLAILSRIEQALHERNHDIRVLSDYFDYIGGTSTGAIIATALALGTPVKELQASYGMLGAEVFKKRALPLWWRSMYGERGLREQLARVIGEGRTLGDADLKTLLLIVLHNTVTDSVWPLSNCTRARYNRADRYLMEKPDRNLDLPLIELIRASTAAPVYFKPQKVHIGRDFVFQDGGITPFNNPAFLMFLMATLPEYGLEWTPGETEMLIVSVGTGSSAAVHPGLVAKQVNILFNAKNLPSVFMNGASAGQDMLCRSLGRTLAGGPVDREFGARIDEPALGGRNLFTYLRYNFDMSDEALGRFGLTTKRELKKVRKLDAVAYIDKLRSMGEAVPIDLDREFAGFL